MADATTDAITDTVTRALPEPKLKARRRRHPVPAAVRDNPHAWFTAFAPADDPQIALAVIVVNGADTSSGDYTGARLAAPIARQVIEAALQ